MPKNARGTTAYTPVRARYVYGNSRDREKPLRYPERCLGAQVGPYFFVPEKERERERAGSAHSLFLLSVARRPFP